MSREKKHLIRLLLLTLAIILLSGSTVDAAVSGFVVEGDDGELYQYSYDNLLDSYALKILGLPNGFYEDFAAKKPYAFLNSSGDYIDYADILDRYASALIFNEQFDLTDYVVSEEAKKAQMPDSLNVVKLDGGQVISSVKILSSGSAEPNATPTPIIGLTKVSLKQAQQWARNRDAHERFVEIASLYWEYGQKTGIRSEVLYAQAAVETDFGHYSNRVPALFNNWAGIKIADAEGDSIENHEIFNNPEEGVRAHYNHMSAYVGLEPVGEPHGRYYVVIDQPWAGSIKHVEELSGKWAPLPDYHSNIVNLIDQIYKTEIIITDSLPEKTDPSPDPESVSDNGSPEASHVSVNVEVLHLRSGPGTDHDILERLYLGTTLKVYGDQAEWLMVTTPADKDGWVHGDYVSEINRSELGESPLMDKIIVVDPGHGGSDPGAVGPSGIQEKTINLSVARKLAVMLEEVGAIVIMVRHGDQSLTNQQRVALANKAKADLYLSIHANAYANPESNGTETHYYDGNSHSSASRYLAHQLQREFISAFSLRDRGVKKSGFYVLKNIEMPAALVEMAFLTNPDEEKLLSSADNHSKAAQAFFRSLESYFLHYR